MRYVSAWLPIAISAAALVVVLFQVLVSGPVHTSDEGTAAHIWQMLMASQIPVIAYFLFKRLPRSPAQTARIVALQLAAALAAVAPVVLLGL